MQDQHSTLANRKLKQKREELPFLLSSHFLDRTQKGYSHNHIVAGDQPPECWMRPLTANFLPLGWAVVGLHHVPQAVVILVSFAAEVGSGIKR